MSNQNPTLEEVGQAVTELRKEIEKKGRTDNEKVERIQTFLDSAEEKINQPIARAQAELKRNEAEVKELKDKLEASGKSSAEVKARVDALELELARGSRESKAIPYKDREEYKALNRFCVAGYDKCSQEQKALLQTDSNVAGGYLVPTEMDTEITKRITEIDPIRSVARVRTIASKAVEMAIRTSIPVADYEGEAEEGGESASLYDNVTVTPYRQTFTTPITMDMLMNAAFDMESEIASDAAEAFAFGEGAGFVSGTGFKQPAGFVVNATLQAGARLSGVSGVLTPNSIILLTGDLKVGYNPVYVLNRRTLALIRTFRGDAASPGDQAGQYLWLPGLNGPVASTINGFPYVIANSMPDVASSAFPIAFGDFRRGYTIVDRTGLTVIRDEVTRKKKAIVEFTMNRWNTGMVTLTEAIKLLQITA